MTLVCCQMASASTSDASDQKLASKQTVIKWALSQSNSDTEFSFETIHDKLVKLDVRQSEPLYDSKLDGFRFCVVQDDMHKIPDKYLEYIQPIPLPPTITLRMAGHKPDVPPVEVTYLNLKRE